MNEYRTLMISPLAKLTDEERAAKLAERQREVREAMGDKWLCHVPQPKVEEPDHA